MLNNEPVFAVISWILFKIFTDNIFMYVNNNLCSTHLWLWGLEVILNVKTLNNL